MRKTDISTKVRKQVYQRENNHCAYCGRYIQYGCKEGTIAHIKTRGAGGEGQPYNLVLLCPMCHKELDHTNNRKIMLIILKKYLLEKEKKNEKTYVNFRRKERNRKQKK